MNKEYSKKSGTPGHKRSRSGTDFSSSLDSYLNSVGKLSHSDPETTSRLIESIDALQEEIGRKLTAFGFTALEFCRCLEECFNSGSSPEDYFLSSSLRQNADARPQQIMEQLKKWQQEIRLRHEELFSSFSKGEECHEKRLALSETLQMFRPNGSMLNELYQAAVGYAEVTPGNSKQAEERSLMCFHEFQSSLEELKNLRNKLEQLHARMAECNLRLVVSIAGKYRESRVPLNDIIQEGNLGLMVAVQRFDLKLGNRFSTYAGWWIKHYILRAIAEQSRVVRLPLHMIQAIQNMNRAEQRFIQNEGREPEHHELAALLEMPVARVSALRKMAAQSLSLQAPLNTDEDSSTLEELIAPEENSEPWRNYARRLLYDKLHEMLNSLPERERQIIIYRFGLCGENALPLGEISSRLNLSRERVRQLENKVMAQLRSKEYLKFIDGLSHLDD